MSGRLLRFAGSVHLETERLLPWLVNGTLQADELALVEKHLGECPACQRELRWLRSLQSAAVDEAGPAADTARSLHRLRGRLAPAHAEGRRGWSRRRPWLHAVIAAQAALVLVLATALMRVSHAPPPTYRTLSAAAVAQARLVVMFDPQISEARLCQLLRASDTRIIYGPTDAGAYVLSVPLAQASTARALLRTSPGVTLVENLGPGDER
jgi:anti-sigma factor RsiW